jgi:hypothetical protein
MGSILLGGGSAAKLPKPGSSDRGMVPSYSPVSPKMALDMIKAIGKLTRYIACGQVTEAVNYVLAQWQELNVFCSGRNRAHRQQRE